MSTLRQGMTPFQKQYCLKLTEKIEKHPISEPFRDQSNNNNNTDFQFSSLKIKENVDLVTIKKRLSEGHYKCINDWGKDVRLIWSNAQQYYPADMPIHVMAQDLSEWFEKKWLDYPRTKEEQWAKKLKKVQTLISALNESFPIDNAFIPEKEETKKDSNEKK
ncbi:Bromodomain containing protein [Tritrichomonas foetus]|uniref:Bromodomain containing protein n=1 Tax=Tritrichomonas foetus TaxID=1144522 RepID=A0A1J4JRS8_9EUKA|nr:Bromodomain containing protein [Tritrichomonas foetus]|eukprot:OHT01825.1 Bromodomain containing protein [Tritrichomonas foetus]